MRKTIATAALTLGLAFAAIPMSGAANATASTDCSVGESVGANGCYPTPDCTAGATRLADDLADVRSQLVRAQAVNAHRLTKIQRQARVIRHLRAALAKARH